MTKSNEAIRRKAKICGVYFWQIAAALGINDGNFSRKLRQELPREEQEKILEIIDELNVEGVNLICAEEKSCEPAKEIFRKRLKQAIEHSGITQSRLAKELGTTPQAISSYVKGKTTPDYDMLRRISDRLNVSIDFLLGKTKIRS